MSKIVPRTIASLALAGMLLPAAARAEGLALNRFEPAPAGDRLFGVAAPYTLGHLVPHIMLLSNYAYNPLVLTRNKGRPDVGSVVSHQLILHADATLTFWDHLTVNLDMPVALAQSGDSPTDDAGVNYASPDSPEFSDLRLILRGTILGTLHSPFSLGVGGAIWFPTGAADSYVSDNTVRGATEVLVGGELDWFYYGAAIGPEFRNSQQFRDIDQGSMMSFAGGLGVLLGEDKQVQLGPEMDVNLTLSDVRPRNTNIELRLGAKYRFLEDFVIGAAAGPGLAPGIGTPDLRVIGLLAYSPGDKPAIADRDGDGIADEEDACPDVVGVPSERPAQHGCPPDQDGDGVPDAQDACPREAASPAEADPARPGCPRVADRDGDGVPDAQDQCPDQTFLPGVSDPHKPGCPTTPTADRDGDGVPDAQDACPDLAPPAGQADPQRPGCPKAADTDGDGIVDSEDACPNESGPANPDRTKHGCPTAVRVTETAIEILQKVEFDFGTAQIKPVSGELLDQIAKVLQEHPEITKVEVQGHTDSAGPAEVNRALSQDRATAVRRALIERKVAPDRLTAQGYGEAEPIADNRTDEGRAKNRRVQFKILERASK